MGTLVVAHVEVAGAGSRAREMTEVDSTVRRLGEGPGTLVYDGEAGAEVLLRGKPEAEAATE